MAFALPLFAHLFDRALDLRPTPERNPQRNPARNLTRNPALPDCAPRSMAAPAAAPATAPQRSWGGPTRLVPAQRPLRVVRLVEGRAGCPSAGRMVISGRMADVCAELDRLAALEIRH